MTEINGSTSDGFHTFDELYHHRTVLFMLLFNELAPYPIRCWKSRVHDDGTMFDGYFIAGITTDDGDATYHCLNRYWSLFNGTVLEKAPSYDGHTPEGTLNRLMRAFWR